MSATELRHWNEHGYLPPFQALEAARIAAIAADFDRTWDDGARMNRHCDLAAVAAVCREADVWG
ncbi:MAG TPA: hypothetical protein VFK18_04045, partial [Luteimonas sp.]|nr:hypothetical protein [Luteimonas sp.]